MSPQHPSATDPSPADSLLRRLESRGVRLSLTEFRRLLVALDEPQAACPVVLVGGTNGKGSVAALVAAIAQAAGYRTGLYTSPHLESVTERIRIDGQAIAPAGLAALLEEVVTVGEELDDLPTYFEGLTAAAFLHFARTECALVIAEVGLGGRLDATNAAQPVLSIVTPVARDHEEYLGEDLGAIAEEKARIVRPGRPAVAWTTGRAVRQGVLNVAAETGARLHEVQGETSTERPGRWEAGRQRIRLRTPEASYEVALRLRGAHQQINLALAVRAAELLSESLAGIDAAAIERGAEAAWHPGRLEEVAISTERRLLLDGAHNPAAVTALRATLEESGEPYDLLFGALADKRIECMLPALASRARRVIVAAPVSPRASSAEAMRELLPEREAHEAESIEQGLEAMLSGRSGLGVVAGSFYLVGPVRRLLRQRLGVPAPATDPLWEFEPGAYR